MQLFLIILSGADSRLFQIFLFSVSQADLPQEPGLGLADLNISFSSLSLLSMPRWSLETGDWVKNAQLSKKVQHVMNDVAALLRRTGIPFDLAGLRGKGGS